MKNARRLFLLASMFGLASPHLLHAGNRQFTYPDKNNPINLPLDHGVHPNYRNEWWYFTGWFNHQTANPIGLQITFFRTAPDIDMASTSQFRPDQILLAHAAIADPKKGRLQHAQIIRRVDNLDTSMKSASLGNSNQMLELSMPGWQLNTTDGKQWECNIQTQSLSMALSISQTQNPWPQGNNGFSKKGPRPDQSSHYLSLTHLNAEGSIHSGTKQTPVEGKFWMDHEWFSSYLDDRAQGWDWVGLHGDDGSALMAFQIRAKDPNDKPIWSYGALRSSNGDIRFFQQVKFRSVRQWQSLETNTQYPVEQILELDDHEFEIQPLFDNQELDSRATSGTIYWEGAVSIRLNNKRWGEGYMELTGYNEALGL